MDEAKIVADARAWYHDAWDPSMSVGDVVLIGEVAVSNAWNWSNRSQWSTFL